MLAERVVEWTERWKQEGRQEGEARVVRQLLLFRFGTLPEWVESRLAAADTENLERWAERVLTVDSLEQVFDR